MVISRTEFVKLEEVVLSYVSSNKIEQGNDNSMLSQLDGWTHLSLRREWSRSRSNIKTVPYVVEESMSRSRRHCKDTVSLTCSLDQDGRVPVHRNFV